MHLKGCTCIKLSAIFMLLATLTICRPTGARNINSGHFLPDFEDTIVDINTESATGHHRLVKRSPLVAELMGPLSRNVRQVDEKTRSEMVYQRMRILLTLLRIQIGVSPKVDILQFINWDRTIQIDQLFFVIPKTIYEVRRVILAARALGMRVRATGAGHTRSPLYPDEGDIMMDVRKLERHDGPDMQINQETTDRPYKTITAMTGTHTFELNEFMKENHVTIYTEPLNDKETLGGMVAAGSHGSTYNATAIPGFVVEMRLMDSAGRLRRFTIEKHPELMRALALNLGTFGIMYDITIKVEPAVTVRVENVFIPVGEVLENSSTLMRQVEGNFMGEISYFPFNNPTEEEERQYLNTRQVPDTWEAARDILWIRTTNIASDEETKGQPIQTKLVLPTKGSLSGGTSFGLLRAKDSLRVARELPDKSYHLLPDAFPIIEPPRWGTETSAAFLLNIDEDFDRPYRAIKYLVEKTERQIKARGSTPMNALLPRFFQNSDCFLCLGNTELQQREDNGHSVVIDFLAPPTQEGFYAAAQDFVTEFKAEQLRPHWAKRHDNIPGMMAHIKDTYSHLIPSFMEQRRLAHVDPCDMFMNSYLIAILGRSTACSYV